MGFNLLSAVAGAAQGAVMGGNPVTIGAGALAGGFGGNTTTTAGGLGNSAQDFINTGYLNATEALNAQQMLFQLQVQAQSQQFDEMTSERSELLREQNALRDVAMEQRKADKPVRPDLFHPKGSAGGAVDARR